MFPEQLRGMFGIAVWDQVRRRGVIARDRLGIKPIYYAVCGDSLVFASELKSLLASGLVPSDLDYEAIDAFLSLGFFPAPATPLAAVKKLEPGCILVIENGKVEERRFWSYPEPTLERGGSVEEWSERLLAELEESVRMRLMSDVPLGAMLSGGLDSSLIVALMAKQMDRPVRDVRGRVQGGRREQRARRRALRRRRARRRTTTSSSSRSPRRRSRSTASSGTSTSRSRISRPLASSRSPRWRRSTSPSRSPVRAPTSCSAATGSIAPPRSRTLWQRVPSPLRRAALARGGARARPAAPAGLHARRARRRRAAALDERRSHRRHAAEARARPARRARRQRCAARDLVPARRPPGRAAAGHALPRRPARARRRHAPLLRSRVDGAFARGARPVPRPSRRRAVRDDAGEPEGASAGTQPRDEARAQARGARPRSRSDHRQAEDRLLQRCRRRLVPRADARGDLRLPARAEPAVRGDARPERGRAARQGPGRRGGREHLRPPLGPDARGLAVGVPAPGAGGCVGSGAALAPRLRERSRADLRGRHARPQRGGEHPPPRATRSLQQERLPVALGRRRHGLHGRDARRSSPSWRRRMPGSSRRRWRAHRISRAAARSPARSSSATQPRRRSPT